MDLVFFPSFFCLTVVGKARIPLILGNLLHSVPALFVILGQIFLMIPIENFITSTSTQDPAASLEQSLLLWQGFIFHYHSTPSRKRFWGCYVLVRVSGVRCRLRQDAEWRPSRKQSDLINLDSIMTQHFTQHHLCSIRWRFWDFSV